jgi:hypothetical protein
MSKLGEHTIFTIKEAAKILDMSPDVLRIFYLKPGKINGFKYKKQWHVTQTAINEFIENLTNPTKEVI